MVVPIHAYPVLGAELPFPKFLKFGLVPVGRSKRKVLPIRCNAPVEFEFKIAIIQDHPAIDVEPLEGESWKRCVSVSLSFQYPEDDCRIFCRASCSEHFG